MKQDELIARLNKFEWNDVEFKKAQRALRDPEWDFDHLVTDQPEPFSGNLVTLRLTKLRDRKHQILQLCEVPRTQADLIPAEGVTHRTLLRRNDLEPLIHAGLLRMTHSEDPNHPKQGYAVTEMGFGLLSPGEPESEDHHGEA